MIFLAKKEEIQVVSKWICLIIAKIYLKDLDVLK